MTAGQYIEYIRTIRRYSARTVEIYRGVLEDFFLFCEGGDDAAGKAMMDSDGCTPVLTVNMIRSYEVYLMDERKESARTVNLHLSVLSGFCRFLTKGGALPSNPVRLVTRPKQEKRLPAFYREEAMGSYFDGTSHAAGEDELLLLEGGGKLAEELYGRRLRRLIVSILYDTGIRRSELIGLNVGSVDFSRRVMSVRGKGDKMREIPLVPSLCEEISLYLRAASSLTGSGNRPDEPLLRTRKGGRLYPVFVDRAIKEELGQEPGITGRKSPHVLRHTIATELLGDGADLNSIKEMLGHSSLAATQVYTHNTIERLQSVYKNAHPRAKNGGKNGH